MTEQDADANRRLGRPLVRQLGPLSRAFPAALAIAIAALFVLGWLTFISVPSVKLTLEQRAAGDWVVADLPVAEFAWLSGVRPDMTVGGFVGPDPNRARTGRAYS